MHSAWFRYVALHVARTWHADPTPDGCEAYRHHFTSVVLEELRRIEGFRGAYVLMRDGHVQVISLWESYEAVQRFAGDDIDRAVVEPAAAALLVRYDGHCTHYEVAVAAI